MSASSVTSSVVGPTSNPIAGKVTLLTLGGTTSLEPTTLVPRSMTSAACFNTG